MEIDRFKSVWQQRPLEAPAHASTAVPSRSLHFLRTTIIHDLQRSHDLSSIFLSFLFTLLLIGVASNVMLTGAGRIAALLFAAALLADGIASLVLFFRRSRDAAAATMLEYIARERRQLEIRLRLERYCRALLYGLGSLMLVILAFGSLPVATREMALETFARMALATSFLAFAWRRARSRSPEMQRELDRYLKELQG